MPISDTSTDPVVADADRRVERAKASLRSRLHLLERKLSDVRDRIDVAEQIRRNPWAAVGISLALGALAGWRSSPPLARTSSPPLARASTQRSLGGLAVSALGALGAQIVRELVFAQLGRRATRWWNEQRDRFPDELGPVEAGDEVYFEQ
jgi:hypothetical protein